MGNVRTFNTHRLWYLKYDTFMKIFGKDFKFPERRIDNDPHTALFWQLSEEKDSEYTKDASKLLIETSLKKSIGRFRIEYWIRNGEAGYSMFDTTKSDLLVAGMEGTFPEKKSKQIEDIKELFAHSEATAILDAK